MIKFIKAIEGQKVKFNDLKGFYNVSTSSIEKMSSNWGFSAQEIHKLCKTKNPEVFITLDDEAPSFTTKNFQAFFTDNDFLFDNMK